MAMLINQNNKEEIFNFTPDMFISVFNLMMGFTLEDGFLIERLNGDFKSEISELVKFGILKEGSRPDNRYTSDSNSQRYFLNPAISFFVLNEILGNESFYRAFNIDPTTELISDSYNPLSIHYQLFTNKSYLDFWNIDDSEVRSLYYPSVTEVGQELLIKEGIAKLEKFFTERNPFFLK